MKYKRTHSYGMYIGQGIHTHKHISVSVGYVWPFNEQHAKAVLFFVRTYSQQPQMTLSAKFFLFFLIKKDFIIIHAKVYTLDCNEIKINKNLFVQNYQLREIKSSFIISFYKKVLKIINYELSYRIVVNDVLFLQKNTQQCTFPIGKSGTIIFSYKKALND